LIAVVYSRGFGVQGILEQKGLGVPPVFPPVPFQKVSPYYESCAPHNDGIPSISQRPLIAFLSSFSPCLLDFSPHFNKHLIRVFFPYPSCEEQTCAFFFQRYLNLVTPKTCGLVTWTELRFPPSEPTDRRHLFSPVLFFFPSGPTASSSNHPFFLLVQC